MANIKSAKKRARQAPKRAARNKQTKASVKTFEKKLLSSIASGDKKAASEALVNFTSKIGKAAQKGVIHSKHASRKIGRLAKKVQTLA